MTANPDIGKGFVRSPTDGVPLESRSKPRQAPRGLRSPEAGDLQ